MKKYFPIFFIDVVFSVFLYGNHYLKRHIMKENNYFGNLVFKFVLLNQ